MARARARRTRARAKDRARARDGRMDGRTAGRSYLFSEMGKPVYTMQNPTQVHVPQCFQEWLDGTSLMSKRGAAASKELDPSG